MRVVEGVSRVNRTASTATSSPGWLPTMSFRTASSRPAGSRWWWHAVSCAARPGAPVLASHGWDIGPRRRCFGGAGCRSCAGSTGRAHGWRCRNPTGSTGSKPGRSTSAADRPDPPKPAATRAGLQLCRLSWSTWSPVRRHGAQALGLVVAQWLRVRPGALLAAWSGCSWATCDHSGHRWCPAISGCSPGSRCATGAGSGWVPNQVSPAIQPHGPEPNRRIRNRADTGDTRDALHSPSSEDLQRPNPSR
jgi:hypothetical protein